MSAPPAAPTPTLRDDFTRADLGAVLVMNNAAIPAVNELDEAALDALVAVRERLVIAEVDGAVAGFLLLLPGPGRAYASLNYQWFSERNENFLYVDRIVIGETYRGLGIGRLLYESAIDGGRHSFPVLCAEVNIVPRNQQSLDFHEALKFVAVGEQDTEGGAKRVVMLERSLTT